MKKYFLFSILVFVAFFPAFSQDIIEKESNSTKISEFHITTGFIINQEMNPSIEDFRALDPQSKLLKHDFSDYDQYDYDFGGFMFGLLLGMQLKEQKGEGGYKMNPLLRAGFSFYSSTPFSSQFSNKASTPYDTLISNKTGETHYVDSVHHNYYDMEYQNDQIRLDLSMLFRTNTASRWALFAGLGLNAGVSILSRTTIYENSFESEEIRYKNGSSTSSYYYNDTHTQQTSANNKTNFGASIYVPLGVDFKIARKSDFWSKIHLRYEARPAINMSSIPELQNQIYTSIQHGLGFKVVW